MVMKKSILLSTTLLTLISLTSCNNKTYYHDLKKLTNYMHTVVFDDYKEDLAPTHIEPIPGMPSCSTISNNNYFARNLDYYYSEIPSFIVKMKASKKRYASVGLTYNINITEDDVIVIERNKKQNADVINIIPNRMVDGINENGVACCLNTCSLEDLPQGTVTGTNPGKPRLYAFSVCRYILDHAKSAKDAIDLLNERDIYLIGNEKSNLHYMIADKDETYVVETFDNRLVCKKKENDERIMTNSYLNLTPEQIKATYEGEYKGDLPNYAHGVERYDKLKEQYNNLTSVDAIRNALKEIRFSNMYPACEEMPTEPINATEDYSQTQIHNNDYPYWKELYEGTRAVLENHRRDLGLIYDTWITTHSVIYDLNNKKAHLVVQEDYSRSFEITFDDFNVKQVDLI